jgi:hypothetical protein
VWSLPASRTQLVLLLSTAAATLLPACKDNHPCQGDQVPHYTSAGCGAQAPAPECGPVDQDACWGGYICKCDGKLHGTCDGWSAEPWAYRVRHSDMGRDGEPCDPSVRPDGPDGASILRTFPAALDLGTVYVGEVKGASVQLANAGNATTGLLSISVAGGDFTFNTNGCPNILAAGHTCDIEVRFAPTSGGVRTGQLTVAATPGGTVIANLMAAAIARDPVDAGPVD